MPKGLSAKTTDTLRHLVWMRNNILDAINTLPGTDDPILNKTSPKATTRLFKAYQNLELAGDEIEFKAYKILGAIKPGQKTLPKERFDWQDEKNWYRRHAGKEETRTGVV